MKAIIEIKTNKGLSKEDIFISSTELEKVGLRLDKGYTPISIRPSEEDEIKINNQSEEVYCIRDEIDEKLISELEKLPNVIDVYLDTPIAPFSDNLTEQVFIEKSDINGVCPIPPCDCQPSVPKGRLVQILGQIGVIDIWKQGYMGEGILIGIVDGGIKALGRVPDGKLGRVIGGWPADWGTRADWNECTAPLLSSRI